MVGVFIYKFVMATTSRCLTPVLLILIRALQSKCAHTKGESKIVGDVIDKGKPYT